jgi:hypothetical protein
LRQALKTIGKSLPALANQIPIHNLVQLVLIQPLTKTIRKNLTKNQRFKKSAFWKDWAIRIGSAASVGVFSFAAIFAISTASILASDICEIHSRNRINHIFENPIPLENDECLDDRI